MSAVVFKQSYKSRTHSGTPGLNVRHLQYIATRPGAVYNKGCGFCLWGRLPEDPQIKVQTDFQKAKQIVYERSKERTMYRAIISVGETDAQEKGYYDREKWEKLLDAHIHDIAKEMGIPQDDLCWCASFHCAKKHPHVHILYWDNSNAPRTESIPKDVFREKAASIRAAFSREINREEIQEWQKQQQEEMTSLRISLRSVCQEMNPEQIIDLAKLQRSERTMCIGEKLRELIAAMPTKGSMKYAYLPSDYKAKVDELVDQCLKDPDLDRQLQKYLGCSEEIARLYSNGGSEVAAARIKALNKLRTDLGNEVMNAVKALREDLLENGPDTLDDIHRIVKEAVTVNALPLPAYHELVNLLPAERIPISRMDQQIPGYRAKLTDVIDAIVSDGRVRLQLQAYALKQAGIDLSSLPWSAASSPRVGDESVLQQNSPKVLFGRSVTDQQYQDYREAHRQAQRVLRSEITMQARQDAGWESEAIRTNGASLLLNMMRMASQAACQRQAAAIEARNNLKTRSKDQSKEAKRERYKAKANQSSVPWDDGFQQNE